MTFSNSKSFGKTFQKKNELEAKRDFDRKLNAFKKNGEILDKYIESKTAKKELLGSLSGFKTFKSARQTMSVERPKLVSKYVSPELETRLA